MSVIQLVIKLCIQQRGSAFAICKLALACQQQLSAFGMHKASRVQVLHWHRLSLDSAVKSSCRFKGHHF